MTSDKMALDKMTSDKMPWCLSKMKRIEQNEQSATKALFLFKIHQLSRRPFNKVESNSQSKLKTGFFLN